MSENGVPKRWNAAEIDSLNQDSRDVSPIFSIGTLVTDLDEYLKMLESFYEKGFSSDKCEYIYIDNTSGNKQDAFKGLNRILNSAKASYVIMCHQDIRIHADDFDTLVTKLQELELVDPKWAVAGNAGGVSATVIALNISHPKDTNRSEHTFPTRVNSLDENFLIIKNSTRVSFSNDLCLFHFYGTDICINADILGYTSYVIDFLLMHLSLGVRDNSFFAARNEFEKKWDNALRSRKILTTCTTTLIDGQLAFESHSAPLVMEKTKYIFQICDNQFSANAVSMRFLPLDVSKSERSDWGEFFAIRDLIKNISMTDNSFYGFLSSNFNLELNIHPNELINLIDDLSSDVDALVLSNFDSYTPFFRNQFMQADRQYSGLLRALNLFLNQTGSTIDLAESVTTIRTSCYSNNIIAKPAYWREWLSLSQSLFNFVEGQSIHKDFFAQLISTKYGSVPLKVLLLRIISTLVLNMSNYRTVSPEKIARFTEFEAAHQKILIDLENLKEDFIRSGDLRKLHSHEVAVNSIVLAYQRSVEKST